MACIEGGNSQPNQWQGFWSRPQTKKFCASSWSKRRIINIIDKYCCIGNKALDAGCGSGFFSKHFVDVDMNVTGIDNAQAALRIAGEATLGRVKLFKIDILANNFAGLINDRFDLIFSDGLLEHFNSEQQNMILGNLASVLSNTGVIISFVPNRWSPWQLIRHLYMPGIAEQPVTLKSLIRMHERNGLEVIETGGINVFPWRFSPEKFLARHFGMLVYVVVKKCQVSPLNETDTRNVHSPG